jgi:protein-S-isoprenylcysteine O-methyltransferase Ste14
LRIGNSARFGGDRRVNGKNMNKKQFTALMFPFCALVIIPAGLLYDLSAGRFGAVFSPYFVAIGILLGLIGLALLVETARALHSVGEGTIAPWEPTRNLVSSGMYAYARNPMIGGAMLVIVGEALVFDSIAIAVYAFVFFIANDIYFRYFEEPSLEKRFGQKYRDYKKSVPMWLPKKPKAKQES